MPCSKLVLVGRECHYFCIVGVRFQVVVAEQTEPAAEKVVLSEALRLGAPCLRASLPDVTVSSHHCGVSSGDQLLERFDVQLSGSLAKELHIPGERMELAGIELGLVGKHQIKNAVTALVAALTLKSNGWSISEHAIREGLKSATLPGRFQVLSTEEISVLGLETTAVILDGAHTKDSAAAFSGTVKRFFPESSVAVIVAMASDKDHQGFAKAILSELKPMAVVLTRVPIHGSYERAASTESLAAAFCSVIRESGLQREVHAVMEAEDLSSAIGMASSQLKASQREPVVCFVGSLYIVGQLLEVVDQRKSNNAL